MEIRQATDASKYVMRLAEGGRVWEVELPESAGGYEMRVPLVGGPLEQMTQADEEMLADTTAASATSQLPQLPDTAPARKVDARQASQKRSYLGTMAKVNEMYTQKRYELALIEVVSLEKEYPQDARIQAMKGSLYLKLGRPKLAREAWEKALSITPNDQGIAEALRELSNRSEE
jgi:tetratricopeptide (TPR) repeat protein